MPEIGQVKASLSLLHEAVVDVDEIVMTRRCFALTILRAAQFFFRRRGKALVVIDQRKVDTFGVRVHGAVPLSHGIGRFAHPIVRFGVARVVLDRSLRVFEGRVEAVEGQVGRGAIRQNGGVVWLEFERLTVKAKRVLEIARDETFDEREKITNFIFQVFIVTNSMTHFCCPDS